MTLSGLKWNLRNLRARLRAGRRRMAWIARHGSAAETTPVFIVGSQRSGTGMIGDCLGQSAEFVNLGESDARAFRNFSLKDDATIARLIEGCRYPYLVFKPLKDSHRISALLGLSNCGKAIWAYRDYQDRVNSAVKQFGRHPLDVFESFVAGNRSHWQLQGASDHVESVICSLDIANLSESDGAALMWWVRNSLYFDREMDKNPRIRLWSYDAFVQDPTLEMERLLRFLGAVFHGYMIDTVHAHSLSKQSPPEIHSRVRGLCDELQERLRSAFAFQLDEGN